MAFGSSYFLHIGYFTFDDHFRVFAWAKTHHVSLLGMIRHLGSAKGYGVNPLIASIIELGRGSLTIYCFSSNQVATFSNVCSVAAFFVCVNALRCSFGSTTCAISSLASTVFILACAREISGWVPRPMLIRLFVTG